MLSHGHVVSISHRAPVEISVSNVKPLSWLGVAGGPTGGCMLWFIDLNCTRAMRKAEVGHNRDI